MFVQRSNIAKIYIRYTNRCHHTARSGSCSKHSLLVWRLEIKVGYDTMRYDIRI